MRALDLGVRTDRVLNGYVFVPEKTYATIDSVDAFTRQLLERLKNSPGIQDAALDTLAPLSSGSNGYVTVDGVADDSDNRPLIAENEITPSYFHVIGMSLVAGRELTDADAQSALAAWRKMLPLMKAHDEKAAEAQASKFTTNIVISKSMAEHYWPTQNAVGKTLRSGSEPYLVVGVVDDVRNNGMREKPMFAAYIPMGEWLGDGPNGFYVSVLTSGPPEAAGKTMRSVLTSIDSTLAFSELQTIPQIAATNMSDTQQEALLLGGLAALALILAAVGTYGVMSYVVSQRTNEIGIRMALGAQTRDVLRMVLRQGGVLIVAGVAIGLVLAFGGARLMKDLLFGVAPFDAATYVGVAVLLAAIALLACWVPARRAMHVDPMVALRFE